MGEVIRFIPKSELERARLVREARAIYDSIFPPADVIGEQGGRKNAAPSGLIWDRRRCPASPTVLKPPSDIGCPHSRRTYK